MEKEFFWRQRQAKIVATLGPSSSDKETIRALFEAGVDMFRLNFSHGQTDDHRARLAIIRALEKEVGRPIAVLADLQGPKLRIGTFAKGPIALLAGQTFRLDMDPTPGDETRVSLPHPEIFQAMRAGTLLLLDDGKVRLRVESCTSERMQTVVEAGHILSERKGVNVPDVVLPLSPLTKKDLADLEVALDMGADWIGLSFVQRPEDIMQARGLIKGRAAIMAKLEKPSAIKMMTPIIERADGVMVARGDLGVEIPPEDVPRTQKHIIRQARRIGKPVIVATQMLESMISCPTPTRAEASDVATAVYDGADAVMLSAETASGAYPLEAVRMMDRIIQHTQADVSVHGGLLQEKPLLRHTVSDAITAAARQVAELIEAVAIVTYTTSGATTLRAARERPRVPIMCLTPSPQIARRMVLSYGVYAILTQENELMQEVVGEAVKRAFQSGIAKAGDSIVITAGVPFGEEGSTNVLRVAIVPPPEDAEATETTA